jgi:hypothetical protein
MEDVEGESCSLKQDHAEWLAKQGGIEGADVGTSVEVTAGEHSDAAQSEGMAGGDATKGEEQSAGIQDVEVTLTE